MKNIVIIGGSKGIGKAITQQQLSAGNHVWVLSRTQPDVAANPNLHYIAWDALQNTFPVQTLPEQIDGLVYCPGTINLKPFHRLTAEEFQHDWALNVMGAIQAIQACLSAMKKSESASIVLFSTVAVKIGMPFHAGIAAAKGAIEGLTRSLSAEFAPKIRVNCVAPSLTQTELAARLLSSDDRIEASNKRHPLQRIGQADDLANISSFLLSDASSWMTGQIIGVDGGMSSVKI